MQHWDLAGMQFYASPICLLADQSFPLQVKTIPDLVFDIHAQLLQHWHVPVHSSPASLLIYPIPQPHWEGALALLTMQSCANHRSGSTTNRGRGRDQNTQKHAKDVVRSDFSLSLNADGLPKLEMSV